MLTSGITHSLEEISLQFILGRETNIQDMVSHVTKDIPVRISSRVTVGHGAILLSCTVLDNALIGMGTIVLDGAIIG